MNRFVGMHISLLFLVSDFWKIYDCFQWKTLNIDYVKQRGNKHLIWVKITEVGLGSMLIWT